jgi:outer membrane lipoprotein SlyB
VASAGLFSSSDSADKVRSTFSQKTSKALVKVAESLDKVFLNLFASLDKTKALNLKVDSHFYDEKIRRYFISFRGTGVFGGKLPGRLNSSFYQITCEDVVSLDLSVERISKKGRSLTFSFNGAVVVSMDQLVYELAKSVPNLAATAALSPAAELLKEFLQGVNVGLLSEAISDTLLHFSTVALSTAGAEIIHSASQNEEVTKIVKSSMKNGSVFSFLALSILKSSAKSVVSLYGASLGATVGSAICPGVGSIVGAYLGSKISGMIAKTIIFQATVRMPVYNHLRVINKYYAIQSKNPTDLTCANKIEKHTKSVLKAVGAEFDRDKFKTFDMVLKKIDKYPFEERRSFVALLRGFQQILIFKVINDQDWYFSKRYYKLKTAVEKWKLEKDVVFDTSSLSIPSFR